MAEFFGVIGQLVKTGAALAAWDYQGEQAEKYDQVQAWTGDVDFYRKWLKTAEGIVLELACGTGRVGLALVQDGADYTGLDLSRDMLAKFKEKAARLNPSPECFQLVQGEMTDFSFPRHFPLIIVPCYSYTHQSRNSGPGFSAVIISTLPPAAFWLWNCPWGLKMRIIPATNPAVASTAAGAAAMY
jgi:SAM-dependent methyltransferase